MIRTTPRRRPMLLAVATSLVLVAAACSSDGSDGAGGTTTTVASADGSTSTTAADDGSAPVVATSCEDVAATYRDVASANPDLPDPELSVTCDDEVVVVATNAIPDYTYVATTPGDLEAQDLTFRIPAVPTDAAEPGEVPLLGPAGVAVDGVPIYGPTEGTGGDVLSLEGALSDCGSHNGPTGFHLHLFGSAEGVDCLYPESEVASGGPLLVGYAFDGYPIYSGLVCADDACTDTTQLASSWELVDDTLFATDTWAAHAYVEGSGDLDECNGREDPDGGYAYYTTPTFPYYVGCYRGVVLDDAGGGTDAFEPDQLGGPGVGGP